MKQYTNGIKTIYATDRAYKVLYKYQGYKEITNECEIKINQDDLMLKTKKELIKMAEEKGIEVDEKMKKADIVETLQ